MTLCRELGFPVLEQMIPREMLYVAEEVFLCGTAAEITPIRSIDRVKIGTGSRGTVAKSIQEEFFAITSGTVSDRHGWLSPVGVPSSAAVL
jgi:branched-chain amino acid aminotransferase